MRHAIIAASLLALGGCAASAKVTEADARANADAHVVAESVVKETDTVGSGGARCNAGVPGREVSEYDTSGDDVPDVRKVFQHAGSAVSPRLVMICREADLNGDGRKDVIRYYDDEGRSLREDGDRNFDGKMDVTVIFQDGKIVRKEIDENQDGKIDHKIFFEAGAPTRAERDTVGRSTQDKWHPNTWEYFEDGKMVRMGVDIDGDQRVDRWDRDQEHKAKKRAEEEAAAKAAADSAAAGASEEGEGGEG